MILAWASPFKESIVLTQKIKWCFLVVTRTFIMNIDPAMSEVLPINFIRAISLLVRSTCIMLTSNLKVF